MSVAASVAEGVVEGIVVSVAAMWSLFCMAGWLSKDTRMPYLQEKVGAFLCAPKRVGPSVAPIHLLLHWELYM